MRRPESASRPASRQRKGRSSSASYSELKDGDTLVEIDERGDIAYMRFELFDDIAHGDTRSENRRKKQTAIALAGAQAKRAERAPGDEVLLALVRATVSIIPTVVAALSLVKPLRKDPPIRSPSMPVLPA